MFCCSVRSSRSRELDSSASPSSQVVAISTRSVPLRQFCTSVKTSDIQPTSATTHDVNHSTQHRHSRTKVMDGGSRSDYVTSSSHQMFEAGDRRPFSGTDSAGMVAGLSDDDYHSPDSAYNSSYGSSNSAAWNSGQRFNGQLPRHHWWSQVTRGPTNSSNHEKFPSWPVTQPSALPPTVGYRAASWTDNTRTNSTEFNNPAGLNSQAEDSSPPSPRSARRYFEEVAARLREQQSRSDFQMRNTTANPRSYAVGNQSNPYHEFDFVYGMENSSPNCVPAKMVAGQARSFRSSGVQECSPGPPPLPSSSPPHDPPPRLNSSGSRVASSSSVERLMTPHSATSPRDVFDPGADRRIQQNGQRMLGMQASPNVAWVESFSETSNNTAQPQQVNARRYVYENGSASVVPGAAEGAHVSDKLSPRVSIDEDDLLSHLDRLPANQRQTSVLRRLSQEYFGASRSSYAINPTGRMSLGSASGTSSTSANDLPQPAAVANVDADYRHRNLENATVAAGLGIPAALEPHDDDGDNFVRTRKTQMSLRKAFGIFDDFEVAETNSKQLPVLTEDDAHNSTVTQAASDGVRVKDSKGRRSSESEFRRIAGDWRNLDRQLEKPAVSKSVAMQRSMSVGSTEQSLLPDVSHSHGYRLSTASDAHSSYSSSSGSTSGARLSLDLPPCARSAEASRDSVDPVKLVKAKSKSLPRDALLPSDTGLAVSFPQQYRQNNDVERLEVP